MWKAFLAVVDRLASLTLVRRDIGTDTKDIASGRRRNEEGNEAKGHPYSNSLGMLDPRYII